MLSPSAETYLYDQLGDRPHHLFQADIVMMLLHAGFRSDVEAILGKPIQVCDPCPIPYISEPDEYARLQARSDWLQSWLDRHPPDRERRVCYVARNPRLPTTPAFQRYRHFKVGRTIRQLLNRGVTQRDIREATRAGWVRFA